jgi:hypothetical protein
VYTKAMNQEPAEVRARPVDPRPAVPKASEEQAKALEVTQDDLQRFKLSYGLWPLVNR